MASVVNITSYLNELSREQRDALYQSPWTCQAVFRSLPDLAKNYVLRLLLIDVSVPQDVIDSWVADKKQHGNIHKAVLDKLLALNLYLRDKEAGRNTYRLHPGFQSRLQKALSTGGQMLHEVPREVLEAAPPREHLDAFAHEQWEALQMYILDPSSKGPQLPPEVPVEPLNFHTVLVNAGLLIGSTRQRSITDKGFQLLLTDSYRQLWTFLHQYIHDAAAASHHAEVAEGGLPSLMSFLMQLGFMRVGQPYALTSLAPTEQVIAGHMMQLGLLLPFEHGGHGYFCPTRLASSLCGGGTGSVGSQGAGITANADIAGGHIIVESNFKVAAWTTSKVQRSILGLFCRCEAALPNFWVGSLTHDSVNAALASGISANEIVAYLQAHAHPQVLKRKPVVPENVSDQVRLWEAETQRLQADAAVLYDAFENVELYESTLAFAHARGLVLWASPPSTAPPPGPGQLPRATGFAAHESGHDAIREFIKAAKGEQARGRPCPPPTWDPPKPA